MQTCPKCGGEALEFSPYDFGTCPETGYRDAGERFYCHDCGEEGEVSECGKEAA